MAETDKTLHDTEDAVRTAVLSSPSIFARLVAVSRLRGEDQKYYHALSWQYGVAAVHDILKRLHRETFANWLALSLRQQERDLTIFLNPLGDDRPSAHGLAALCHALVPKQQLQPERALFLSDVRLVINLVYGETVALPLRAAAAIMPLPRRPMTKPTATTSWTNLLWDSWLAHRAWPPVNPSASRGT